MEMKIFALATILVAIFLVPSTEAFKGRHCKCLMQCEYGYEPSGYMEAVSAYDDLRYIQCTCECKITEWYKKELKRERRHKTRLTRSRTYNDLEYYTRIN